MNEKTRRILLEGAIEIGAPLSETQLDLFSKYMAELVKWNKKLNLTSLDNEIDIAVKHFIDSLTPLVHIGMGSFVMDLGSGAGFPGIPMKIARSDLRLLLIESTGKKVAFLNNLVRQLKLSNIRSIAQRAESETFGKIMEGHLDVVISRAFGDTEKILEIGAPYLKKGGKLIAMKGARWNETENPDDFRTGAHRLIRREAVELELPALGDRRALLIYEKG